MRNIWHIDAHLAHRNTSGTSAHIWHIGAYIWHIWHIRGQDIGKLSLPMGSFIRIHQGHHRVRNQGECYSSLSADSVLTQPRLWDCSLFFSPVGWPRVPRTSIAAGACIPFPSVHLSPCRFTRNSRYPKSRYLTPISRVIQILEPSRT